MRNFVVVGESRSLVAQVLLAIHSIAPARCMVVCGRGTGVLRLSSLCCTHVEADFYGRDDVRFVDLVHRFAATRPDAILIAADCEGARLVNRVRPQLRVALGPIPDLPMLDCLDNKWHFHQFCTAHGLNVPETLFFSSKAVLDFDTTARQIGAPFVVKPLNQAISTGVHVIGSAAELAQRITEDAHYQYAPLIAQRYIAGIDVGLNLLAIDGKVRALAVQTRENSRVRFFHNDYLEQAAHILVTHSRYHGVMNVDARIEAGTGKVFLFESNPRFWRSLAASVWCGMNFLGEGLQPGVEPVAPPRLTCGAADVYYHPLLRPCMWRHVLFDRGRQGRMSRIMAADPYFFLSSLRPMAMTVWQVLNWRLLRRRIQRVY